MVVAIVVASVFCLADHLIGRSVNRAANKRGRKSLGELGGPLTRWTTVIVGSMFAPSITPDDPIAGLDVSSVANGFAFKDILQNMLAGILILLRQPFEVGDQIVSDGHEGTVKKIENRVTMITTYDGRRVVTPNSVINIDSIIVSTTFETRRSEYDVGIGYNDDWDATRCIIEKTCAAVDGVE